MLKKNLVLGSLATLALAVTMSSAFAQSAPQYPDFSLPWEMAETASLNIQQASEPGIIASTTTTTTGVVASTNNSADVAAYNQALTAQQTQQSQFQSSERAYQRNLQDYRSKLNTYDEQMQGVE